MSEAYAREILRRNVAQICQTIGWNGINSTPVDILVHVLEKYIKSLGTQANRYAEQFNRTEPNLHDLGLVFRDLHISLPDLAEYTCSVPPVPPPVNVEKFPKHKESNLNFLKPGSHEVVTRPVHVHEHLPPMYPEKERDTPAVADTVEIQQNGIDTGGPSGTCDSPDISVTDSPEKPKELFKRPTDPISLPNSKRPRLRMEEEERTREISSVMMTMSGFLSPAREGKLPEAKVPPIVTEKHEKHKVNSHHSSLTKAPMHSPLDKPEKKSKKNKLVNGKVVKSKKRDKSHKSESNKSKDKSDKHSKSKDSHVHHNHTTVPVPMPLPIPKSFQPPPHLGNAIDHVVPLIKQEPIDHIPSMSRTMLSGEDSIPVPKKIPISRSPLTSHSSVPTNKSQTPTSLIQDVVIKKEKLDEEEKLASQPDRSKINIFKRISNKSKEDKSNHDVLDKSQASISRYNLPHQESFSESRFQEPKHKTEDSYVNNNDDYAVDLSKQMDLTTNEVISIDDDLNEPLSHPRPSHFDSLPNPLTINKSIFSSPIGIPGASTKQKKEKKHKEKKDKAAEKAAKLEAKLLKKQQQQIAMEMARIEKMKMGNMKSPKLHRPKNNMSKHSPLPPGFPFFPNLPPGGLMPGPGLIHNSNFPGGEFLAELANNPALRGLSNPNLLANPFVLGAGGPGLIPGPSYLPGLHNNLIPPISNINPPSRSNKIPSMLRRRPSLEVIPVDNDDDRGLHKTHKDRHEKHKSPTIPNILQKNKNKAPKDSHHKSNLIQMPPIHPDITIELNPPKSEPEKPYKPDPPVEPPPLLKKSPTPEPVPIPPSSPPAQPSTLPEVQVKEENEKSDKKKDKSHKKEKRDKDGIKIKKKKDKKDKNKDKSEKKKDKDEVKIKKEKKDKKKDKTADGLVPKLTLKLGTSSPMPPSSPDIFKLNIKPVVKKEEEEPVKEERPRSREQSRSPELAQFSALVTRPPKPKCLKQNNTETETQEASPPSVSSPTRKNRPPSSSHTKYKRILFKTLAKKGQVENFNEEVESDNEEGKEPSPSSKPSGPLPTPYYVDEHGNKVWVCPACGQPDNGSPMIGCDGCDGWYHWVCVGITEEPGAEEDWFCKSCIAKRAAMSLAGVTAVGRKRGRKPKVEKIRDCH